MSESDAQAFEEYCLANPDFARHVEFEQRLKGGIAQVARNNTAEFVRFQPTTVLELRGRRQHRVRAVRGLLSVAPLHASQGPGHHGRGHRRPPGERQLLRLALVRGNEGTPELPEGLVRVAIAGLFDTGFQYSVALDRLDPNRNIDTVATLYGQHPASSVTLEVMIDSDRLEPGTYSCASASRLPAKKRWISSSSSTDSGQLPCHRFARRRRSRGVGSLGAAFDWLGVQRAWARTRGSPDVVIAIVGEGVQVDHPLLGPNIKKDHSHRPESADAQEIPGTHAAGVAAGRHSEVDEFSGVAPGARILPVRFAPRGTARSIWRMRSSTRWKWARASSMSRMARISRPQACSARSSMRPRAMRSWCVRQGLRRRRDRRRRCRAQHPARGVHGRGLPAAGRSARRRGAPCRTRLSRVPHWKRQWPQHAERRGDRAALRERLRRADQGAEPRLGLSRDQGAPARERHAAIAPHRALPGWASISTWRTPCSAPSNMPTMHARSPGPHSAMRRCTGRCATARRCA